MKRNLFSACISYMRAKRKRKEGETIVLHCSETKKRIEFIPVPTDTVDPVVYNELFPDFVPCVPTVEVKKHAYLVYLSESTLNVAFARSEPVEVDDEVYNGPADIKLMDYRKLKDLLLLHRELLKVIK